MQNILKNGKPIPWWGIGLIMFAVSIVTYANCLHNEFMIDDYGLILDPTLIHHPKHIWKMLLRADHFNTESLAHYRPVSDVMRIILYHFCGHNPFGYHLANIALLSIFCVLVFYFVFMLTKDFRVGLFTSVLMAVHPINTMAVNYITAHEVILYGIFGLSSLISFMGFLNASTRAGQAGFYFLSIIFFILSFLTQEIMMLLPAYIVLVFIYLKGWRFKPALMAIMPYAVVAVFYIIWRMGYASIKTNLLYNILQVELSFGQYAATVFALIGWYVSKLFFPHEIIFLWSMKPLSGPVVAVSLLIAAAFAISFCLYIRKADKRIRFAGALFVLGLLPAAVLCFVYPPMGLVIEPHWFLVPSIGYFMFVAILLDKCAQRSSKAVIVFCLLAVVWMFKTIEYNVIWRTQKSYCQYWLGLSPENHGPNFWLAHSYLKEGRYDLAQKYFQRALVGGFMDWQVYLNLGLIAFYEGRYEQAVQEYEKAISLHPRSGVTYNNLGLLFQEQGDAQKAESYFRAAIEREHFMLEPRWNLAELYRRKGDWDTATKYWEENFELDPSQQQTLYLLTKSYLLQKRYDKLKLTVDRFLRYGDNSEWLVETANLLAEHRSNDTALLFYRRALVVDPTNKMVYRELGKFYGNTQRLSEAIGTWEYGLKLYPDDQELPALISQARQWQGQQD